MGLVDGNDLDTLQIDLYRKALRDGCGHLLVTWGRRSQPSGVYVHAQDDGLEGVTTHLDPETHLPQYYANTGQPMTHSSRARRARNARRFICQERYASTSGRRQCVRLGTSARPWRHVHPLPWLGIDGRPIGFAVWSFRVPGGSELSPSALALQDSLNTSMLDLLSRPRPRRLPIMSVRVRRNVQAPVVSTP